jgi:tetratricopeptide (TPR) repeat protein
LPDYVGAPGSEWLPLAPGNPRTAGSWRLFARHAQARTESGLFLGRGEEDGMLAVLRLTRARSRARATLAQQAGALHALEGRQAPRLLEEAGTWLATEVFPGGRSPRPATSLAARLEADGRLPRDVFARVAQETTTVLARAHALGVVHGGLSAQRILWTGRLVCVTGWAVDEHPDGAAHDVQRLGTILLDIGEPWLGEPWRSEPLRALLRRCSSPILADRPTAAQLALSFRYFTGDAVPPTGLPELPPDVTLGSGDGGGRVVLDLATMGPHGRIHGPFNVRATLLRAIVNGMLRRRYTPDETRFMLLGDARLYLDPPALNLRQITHYGDVPTLAADLTGELRRRELLLGEARAAMKAPPAMAAIVVVTEEPDHAAVRAWLDSLPAGLGLHVVVLDTAVSTPPDQGYLIEIGRGGRGRLQYPGAPGDGSRFRPLSPVPPTDDADRLREEQQHASSLGRSGRVEEALRALRRITAQQQALLGTGHRDTLTSRYELGYLCLRSGLLEEALDLYRDTADGLMFLLGADHHETLAARQQCAYTLGRMGRLDEACAVYRAVLESWQRAVGPDDHATLHCRHSLAAALNALGRHAEAVTEARAVVESRGRRLGPDAEDTLASAYQLTVALHASGAADEAAMLAEDLHVRQLRVLGPDHPETADIRRILDGRAGRYPQQNDHS